MKNEHPFSFSPNEVGEVCFSITHWEKVMTYLQRGEIIPGVGVQVIKKKNGQLVSVDSSVGFRHPWFVEPEYINGDWRIRVQPGFVNGISPVSVEGKSIEDVGVTLPIGGFVTTSNPPEFFRRLGFSGGGGGVMVDGLGENFQILASQTNQNNRFILQCDVIIQMRRGFLKVETNIVDPTGITGRIVDRGIVLDTSYFDPTPRILVVDQTPEEKIFNPLDIILYGTINDDGIDTQKICTVYWVSPEGQESEKPGPDWLHFVKYEVFWNLSYELPYNPLTRTPSFFIPLPIVGGGVASAVVGQVSALTMDMVDLVSKALTAKNYVGRFWTV